MTTDSFNEVAHLVFGGGLDEVLKSAESDRKKYERRQAQVGLASNVVGLAAGVAGTKDAYSHYKKVKKIPPGGTLKPPPIKVGKLTKVGAGALLGLQVANIGGDAVANRVLARGAKSEKKKVSKANPDQADVNLPIGVKGKLVLVGHAEKQARKQAPKVKGKFRELAKSAEVVWEGEFSKFDMDKRQVFGWASIVKKDGEDIVDLQGDYISIDEIEKSAYDYVQKSRKGGNQHQRDGEDPYHVSDMIESFIVTPEKIEKMGLPDDTPLGWWVGYQINDPETWDQVKSGKRTGFSIHGRGRREGL